MMTSGSLTEYWTDFVSREFIKIENSSLSELYDAITSALPLIGQVTLN